MTHPPRGRRHSVFPLPSEPVEHLPDLSDQDREQLRLLLRGESVIDWHRMRLASDPEARRLLRLNGLDPADPVDQRRLASLRDTAVRYISETLGLKLPTAIAHELPPEELLLLASSRTRHSRHACTLLKVMHIQHHLDARELSTALPIPSNELFARVEESVVGMFDELRAAGVPVVEFAWSRKTRTSLITKLLVKRETSAARIFDRLRFRMVVEQPSDLLPTLRVILQHFIPFNYVVPGQTINTLIDPEGSQLADEDAVETADPDANEFSASSYRVLNFVADLPVRVDTLVDTDAIEGIDWEDRGRIVFVLAEFQLLDRATAEANEQGESSHVEYKSRQHGRVRERLLREPKS